MPYTLERCQLSFTLSRRRSINSLLDRIITQSFIMSPESKDACKKFKGRCPCVCGCKEIIEEHIVDGSEGSSSLKPEYNYIVPDYRCQECHEQQNDRTRKESHDRRGNEWWNSASWPKMLELSEHDKEIKRILMKFTCSKLYKTSNSKLSYGDPLLAFYGLRPEERSLRRRPSHELEDFWGDQNEPDDSSELQDELNEIEDLLKDLESQQG
ncbi:hypothetical protein F5Y15DRAFT_332128 [Xylariaceae sp. FL0016]|nr:hypothetical protein F5Y15DRAFT_332128 [Xylariaceae sp. FL0016]